MKLPDAIASRREELRQRFPRWLPRTLDRWLDDCAERYPERPMVLTDAERLTYRDVADQSHCLAAGLVRLGVRPGDRVGLVMANYPQLVTLKFAIARVGAIAVPFNYLYRADELNYVLNDSGCSVLITMTAFGKLDYQEMLDGIVPGWAAADFGERPVGSDSLDRLRHVVVLPVSAAPRSGARTVEQLAVIATGAQNAVASRSLPGEVADILYTSGTTGFPKGVQVTHDAVLRTAYASALTRAYEDGRRILFSLPCYHMFGYVEGFLSAMFVGGAIVPLVEFSAESYFAGIERHGATDVLCVPTMAVAMVESPARERYDLSSVRSMLCGSAPAPTWLWRQVKLEFGINEIVTGYGMTECGGAMTLTLPEDPPERISQTVGRPKMAGCAGVPGTDCLAVHKAVDPQSGADTLTGEEGELVSTGPTAMVGYWNRPEDTAKTLRGGWLHSGDLGKVDAQGYLQITGRSKELYKSGGELVMPREIEDLLASFDDISQVFVVGVTDVVWGEIGCAVVVPAPGATVTEDEIIDRCRSSLARFKVPKKVLFYRADQLPITPTGKVQKFRLAEQIGQLNVGRR